MKHLLMAGAAALGMILTSPSATIAQVVDTSYLTEAHNLSPEDDIAIRQVIARLNHALDAEDYAMYGSFFADDGVFESDFGDAVGPEAVAAALDQVRPFIQNRRHIAANTVISGEGDRAVVTTYLIVFERVASLDFVGSAINVDTMERRDGVWQVVRHYSELDPATAAFIQEMMSGSGN